MDAEKAVRECSEQLKRLIAEQRNTLDASVAGRIEEVIATLDDLAANRTEGARIAALISVSNLLRVATNIADLISKIRND